MHLEVDSENAIQLHGITNPYQHEKITSDQLTPFGNDGTDGILMR